MLIIKVQVSKIVQLYTIYCNLDGTNKDYLEPWIYNRNIYEQ